MGDEGTDDEVSCGLEGETDRGGGVCWPVQVGLWVSAFALRDNEREQLWEGVGGRGGRAETPRDRCVRDRWWGAGRE